MSSSGCGRVALWAGCRDAALVAGVVAASHSAVLRHYCASSLYGGGVDIKALQELLGHQWLATTSGYVHVRSDHIEQAWVNANRRLENRFGEGG